MIGIVVVLALSLPFVINQVLKKQDVRQRADSAPAISLNFNPQSNTTPLAVGETLEVNLLLNTALNEDIGALHFILNYDKDRLQAPTVTNQNTGLKIIHVSPSVNGKYEATMINVNSNPMVTGNNLHVITFRFIAKAAGTAQISLDQSTQVTAATYTTYVPISNIANVQASFTISGNSVGEPTRQPDGTVRYCGENDHVSCEIGLYSCFVNIANGVGKTCSSTPGQNGTYNCIQCILATPTPRPTQAPSPTLTPSPTPSPTPTPSPIPTPLPTSTPIPTPTIGASETSVKVAVTLPGIGNTISGDNNAPHTTTRQVTALVHDAQNALVPSSIGVLTYNSTNGKYEGQIGVGVTSTTSASYRIKLKLNNTLFKFVPGIITIIPTATTNNASSVELVPGDLTGASNTADNSLDILDYNLFQACYRGQAACTTDIARRADFNDNGVVNGDDVDANILSRGFYIRNGD